MNGNYIPPWDPNMHRSNTKLWVPNGLFENYADGLCWICPDIARRKTKRQ